MIDLKSPPFALLAERDMDLVVLEEMLTSSAFESWLVDKLYKGTRKHFRTIGAWHMPTLEPLGSVNILFIFQEANSRRRCAIVIENKIDQPKQNLQAQRYFEFGEKGVQDGLWDEYLTCLFSPQAYFSSLEPSEYFSSYLSYEEIEQWFSRGAIESRSVTPERAVYKKTLVRQAINQGTGMMQNLQHYMQQQEQSWATPVAPMPEQQPEPDYLQPIASNELQTPEDYQPSYMNMPVQETIKTRNFDVSHQETTPAPQPKQRPSLSDFRVFPGGVFNLPAGYRETEDTFIGNFFNELLAFSKQYFTVLGLQKPTGSAEEAAWVELTPAEFPKEVKIIHKMPQGFMDLSFAMTPLAMIQGPYQAYIDNDMLFKESGKTAIIRINVPTIDPQQGFEQQKAAISFALQKAQKLYLLYTHIVNKDSKSNGQKLEELYL